MPFRHRTVSTLSRGTLKSWPFWPLRATFCREPIKGSGTARCMPRLECICDEASLFSLGGPRGTPGGGLFFVRSRRRNPDIGSRGLPPAASCATRNLLRLRWCRWRGDNSASDVPCEKLWPPRANAGSNLPKLEIYVFSFSENAHVLFLRLYARAARRRRAPSFPLPARFPPAYTVSISSFSLASGKRGN